MEIFQQYSANDRQDLFKDWHHQYYKMIRKVVIETTMDESLVDDIFQNSSIVIYEKLVRNELHLTSKLSTFLYSVAYKMCMEQIRKKKKIKIVSFEDDFENREDKVYDADKEAMYKQLDLCVEKLPETKKKIVKAYYYFKNSMDSIAELYDLKDSDSVKTQKYKAIIDLKDCFKKHKAA